MLLLCGFNGSCCQPSPARGGNCIATRLACTGEKEVEEGLTHNNFNPPHVLRGSHLYCFLESKQHGDITRHQEKKNNPDSTFKLPATSLSRPKWEFKLLGKKIQGGKEVDPRNYARRNSVDINPLGRLAHSPLTRL